MKPILVLPPDNMSAEDIALLREIDICVVVAKNPADLRFIDPPPTGNYDQVTEASLNLSRLIINNTDKNYSTRELASFWAQALINAHPVRKQTVTKTEEVTSDRPKRPKGR